MVHINGDLLVPVAEFIENYKENIGITLMLLLVFVGFLTINNMINRPKQDEEDK